MSDEKCPLCGAPFAYVMADSGRDFTYFSCGSFRDEAGRMVRREECVFRQLAALKAALRFYADRSHWNFLTLNCQPIIEHTNHMQDGGAMARAALKETDDGETGISETAGR